MDPETRTELDKLFEQSNAITVDPRALERTFTIPKRKRAIVREFRDAHEKGFMGQGQHAPLADVEQDHCVRGDEAARRDTGGIA